MTDKTLSPAPEYRDHFEWWCNNLENEVRHDPDWDEHIAEQAFAAGFRAAATPAPAQPNTWREAVLDALASTGGDMPVTATPAEIVRAVIDANVQIALDPRVSDAAPAQQPEPWAWGRVHPDGEFTGDLLLNTSIEDVRKRSGAWVPLGRIASPSVQHRKPLTERQVVGVLREAGCIGTVKMSYESGPYDIDRPSINATRLVEAVEAAHGITAAPEGKKP